MDHKVDGMSGKKSRFVGNSTKFSKNLEKDPRISTWIYVHSPYLDNLQIAKQHLLLHLVVLFIMGFLLPLLSLSNLHVC